MGRTELRRTAAAGALLALGACGGRALFEDGAAGIGQSGAVGVGGGQAAAGAGVTAPQGGAPASASGGNSAAGANQSAAGCNHSCLAMPCAGGTLVTLPGQCCPICLGATPMDAGVPPPPMRCSGLAANPPLWCPLTLTDVACTSDVDCTLKMVPFCSPCVGQIYAVNRTSTATCGPVNCPLEGTCSSVSFELQTQDCVVVPKGQLIVSAHCVAGQCWSFSSP
jgi:hypothetical protein